MAGPIDLQLTADNELVVVNGQLQLTSGVDWVRQALQTRLRLIQGEWFVDTTEGTPMFNGILGKNPSLAFIRSILRQRILGTPHVASVDSLVLSLDRASRELTVTFSVSSDFGQVNGSVVLG